jgi:hypothetical protein
MDPAPDLASHIRLRDRDHYVSEFKGSTLFPSI